MKTWEDIEAALVEAGWVSHESGELNLFGDPVFRIRPNFLRRGIILECLCGRIVVSAKIRISRFPADPSRFSLLLAKMASAAARLSKTAHEMQEEVLNEPRTMA